MSKKHYIAIARILRESSDRETLVRELARYFAGDNPRFDRDRFLTACKVQP